MDYNALADKFLQLTPWVQAALALILCALPLGIIYCVKEMVKDILAAFHPQKEPLAAPPEVNRQSPYR